MFQGWSLLILFFDARMEEMVIGGCDRTEIQNSGSCLSHWIHTFTNHNTPAGGSILANNLSKNITLLSNDLLRFNQLCRLR